MDKRAQVLCMGLLVKSPTKYTEKAIFAPWWKVRWCVLTKITYDGAPQKTKLVLSYYKDEESHRRDENSEGQLLITECISIRSHYMSKAGFQHIFIIKQSNGKDVFFSAPTCQLKSKWIVMLYSYKFNSSIKGSDKLGTSSFDSRRSETSRAPNTSGLGVSRKDSIDSGTFSRTLTINSESSTRSISSQAENSPPPLPERRKVHPKSSPIVDEPRLLEDLNWIFTKLQTSPKSQRSSNSDQSDVSSSEDKIRMQSIVDALFPWCKSCDEQVHKKKSIKKTMSLKGVLSSKKRKSLKKRASSDIGVPLGSPRESRASSDIGVPLGSPRESRDPLFLNRQSIASSSSDGYASDDSCFEEREEYGYTDIAAEEWIQQVRQKLEDEKQTAAEAADAESNDHSGAGNDDDNNNDDDDDNYDCTYVDMNVIKEMQAAKTSESTTAVDEPLQTEERTLTENEDLKRENDTLRKMLELLQASKPQMLPAELVEKETKIDGKLVFEMTL